ncbi:hypothetical protein BDV93DRAFT_509606 [Ceratobasidium sp. AG-I]|nr:hypothetical protein BDV93DRAFT_509606 [Ceratobasidium sp. AG-I]
MKPLGIGSAPFGSICVALGLMEANSRELNSSPVGGLSTPRSPIPAMGIRKKGGYYSSDEEDPEATPPPPKKTKFAPLRLAGPAFQLPGTERAQTPSSRAQTPSSRAETPPSRAPIPSVTPGQKVFAHSSLRTAFPTPNDTPGAGQGSSKASAAPGHSPTAWNVEKDFEGSALESPVVDVRSKGKSRVVESEAGPSKDPVPSKLIGPSLLALEREVDSININVADFQTEAKADICALQEDNKRLMKEVEGLKKLFAQFVETSRDQGQSSGSTSTTLVAPAQPSIPSTQLLPTPDSVMTVELGFDPRAEPKRYVPVSTAPELSNIASLWQQCKKNERAPIPEEAPLKKLIRTAYFGSLDGVSHVREIKAPIFDARGTHLLFPPEYQNPQSGWSPSYPDWENGLHNQAEFLVRVISRIRTMAPQNTGDLSVTARTIKEEILIDLILAGPWKSCKQYWSAQTPEEQERLRQQNRRYKRKDLKLEERLGWREEVPDVQGEAYDVMYHKGLLSEEHSDPENQAVIHVYRTDLRSSVVNNTWDAGARRAKKKRANTPGHQFRPRRRIIHDVPAPDGEFPDLRRGKAILPVPLCLLSKRWRCDNQAYIDNNPARFLTSDQYKKPPDVSAFTDRYPVEDDEDDEDAVDGDDEDEVLVLEPEAPRGDAGGVGAGDDDAEDEEGWKADNEDDCEQAGEQELGGLDDMEDAGDGDNELDPSTETRDEVSNLDTNIDPALLEQSGRPKPRPRPKPVNPSQIATSSVGPATMAGPPLHDPPAAPPASAVPEADPDTPLSESAQARPRPPVPPNIEPPADAALPVNRTHTPATDGESSTRGSVPPNGEKPKRTRRTNAQIAADKAAKEAAKAAAVAAGLSTEKQKRKRRTKVEMIAARALEAAKATTSAETSAGA